MDELRLTHLERILLNSDAMLLFTALLAWGVILSLVGFNRDIRKARPRTRRVSDGPRLGERLRIL